MGRKSPLYTFNRDNLIVGIIRQHEGIENAINSCELVKLLKDKGYEVKCQTIHTIMSKIIRERNLPIVSSSSWGYCWGNKRSDFEVAVKELQMKVDELNKRIAHLNKFIIK